MNRQHPILFTAAMTAIITAAGAVLYLAFVGLFTVCHGLGLYAGA